MNKEELATAIALKVVRYYTTLSPQEIDKECDRIKDDLLHWSEEFLLDFWLRGIGEDIARWVIRESNRHGFLPYECVEARLSGNDFCYI